MAEDPQSPRTPPERAPSTRLLGPFELMGELGRGGMGVVYRARDGRDGREVALKVLLEGIDSSPARLERFRREAILTAALEHPGIVRALSAGVTSGRPWVSFELVDGARTFQEVFKTAPVQRRAELIRDAARALGFAHRRSVIHRDVKPANLLVDHAGRVRVTDFGLAAARGLAPLTQTGSMLGTPLWMSPEQAGAQRDQVGPPSDVWGLGVILYEALTGTLPFEAPSVLELVNTITRASARAPHLVTAGVDRALEAVCLRALQRDPARRYPDGEAMAEDLDRCLAASRSPPSAPRPGGRRTLLVVHVTLGVAGAVLIAGLLLRRARGPEVAVDLPVVLAPPTTPTPIPTSTPAPPVAADASPQAVALRALRYGAQRGDRDCLYGLARAVLDGSGVAREPAAALPWLLQAAALGHGAAANALGGLFLDGRGVPKNERRAREWFKRAADLDDPAGMANLGALMSEGVGGARDVMQALTLFRAAAERGSPEASFRLGRAFERGEGVDVNRAEALVWLRRAASKDHPRSMLHLSRLLEAEAARRPEAREEAARWLRRAAELGDAQAKELLAGASAPAGAAPTDVAALRRAVDQGDPRAAADLGLLYLDGLRGVEKDLAQAEALLRRAVDGGFAGATVPLASLLQSSSGERAEAARREAIELLRRGVEAGDLPSMTNLGHAFASGEGVARDDVQAAALFLRGAEGGEVGAMRNLSLFLRDGRGGLSPDPAQALSWARRAADGGRTDAMLLAAEQLANGLGCERDPAEAARWLRLAAEKGDVRGMFLLAQQLRAGPPEGRPEGGRWLHKAAQLDHVEAQVQFARAVAKGQGFTRRPSIALNYGRRAAALGSSDALVFVGRLFDDLGREVLARELLRAAADAKVPSAMVQLARLLERGRGGPVDVALASSLRARAVEAGHPPALAARAAAVVATDPAAAVALWRRAAEADHTGSMVELGRRTPERAAARAWLERAAALGDAEARLMLAMGSP